MKRDPVLYLEDILESIEKIEEYTKKSGRKVFFDSSEKQDAVVRRLEIIGEAVKNIPDDIKADSPQIPWKRIAGLRDILTHAYFGVNILRVWNIVAEDLPEFKKELRKVLKSGKTKVK